MALRTRVIGDVGINWNWYLCADFDEAEKTVHINYYERWHRWENRGTGHPANAEWNAGMEMMEDAKREVYGVRLEGTDYLVTNPGYVFNYRDFSKYVGEREAQ